MKKIVRIVFVILVFFVVNLYLCIHLFRCVDHFRLKNAPLAIDVIYDDPPELAGIVDIDRDGYGEVVFCQGFQFSDVRDIWIFDPQQNDTKLAERCGKITTSRHYYFFDAYLEKNSKSVIFRFVAQVDGDLAVMELCHPSGTWNKLKLDALRFKLKESFTGFSKPIFVDLDMDGKAEMLIKLHSFYIHRPRGIVCFDPVSGKSLWQYYCGTIIEQIETRDLDGDGNKEVILSTSAINNGAEMNGSDDAHSYLVVLDSNGNERWKHEVGEWYTFARSLVVVDLDGDSRFEIVTATESVQAHPEKKGTILVLDSLTGKEKNSFSLDNTSFTHLYVKKFGRQDTRIYVGDGSGGIHMFDRDLKHRKTLKEQGPIKVLNGWTPSIKWNVLLANTYDRLLAFDWNLERKVFDYPFEKPHELNMDLKSTFLKSCHTTNGHEALIYSDNLYRLRQVKISIPDIIRNLVISGLLPMIIALLLFNAFFAHTIQRLKSLSYPLPGKKKFKQVSQFLDIIQEIAQKLKNPITTISWTAEKIKQRIKSVKKKKDRDNFVQLSGFLMEDVKILRQQTNHLLKLIRIYKPRFKKITFKPLLQHLVDRYRTVMDERIEIRLEMDEDISLTIDEELFKEALVNLIDNAIDAMPDGGKITISVVPVISALKGNIKQVLVELEDTGYGISGEDLTQVFTPFFTKKQKRAGTGLGLTICQRIIQAHGGTIEIFSRENFGTKVVIKIPTAWRTMER